ncbi:hypothetical protein CTI12_AA241890 [Artemisia annua]|uniref:Uncharacterized protein n=1 Tax=Artemisia annua TaxID=35608 RepID=A0A2U1NPW5_ARTAN|nr:hypothetical protein CTI12_AA241890 [Artemisia annua]
MKIWNEFRVLKKVLKQGLEGMSFEDVHITDETDVDDENKEKVQFVPEIVEEIQEMYYFLETKVVQELYVGRMEKKNKLQSLKPKRKCENFGMGISAYSKKLFARSKEEVDYTSDE